jgi:hypothetical protein
MSEWERGGGMSDRAGTPAPGAARAFDGSIGPRANAAGGDAALSTTRTGRATMGCAAGGRDARGTEAMA